MAYELTRKQVRLTIDKLPDDTDELIAIAGILDEAQGEASEADVKIIIPRMTHSELFE